MVNPENEDIHSYFGIAKVKILAAAKLYHPILPKMINNKLMFPPCGKCVEQQMEKPWLKRTEICSHTEDERCMIGTWCTPELQKAGEFGYQVKKIYEVWHFPEDQLREGLFAEYVNKWLKSKQEATGWQTEDQKPV